MKIKNKIILTSGIGICCKNREEIIQLLTLANSLGYRWRSGLSFLNEERINTLNSRSYCDIIDGTHGFKEWTIGLSKLITFDEFTKNYKLIKK